MGVRWQEPVDEDNWMFPPAEGWTFDQVKNLELPFDWELVDGRIVAKGQPGFWHNDVRDGIADALKAARAKPYRVLNVQRVMVDEQNIIRPDVIVFDPRNLDYFEVECIPTSHLTLVVEVVSPGSRRDDRVSKPAQFAAAKVPCYWRVELGRDHKLTEHEYWLNADTLSYIPAPLHPVHRGKLATELPFPVQIDLDALVGF